MATNNSIDNKVTSGNFTITAGNLLLPTTSSTVGQITLNGNRYLHGYGTDNVFLGTDSGNFTLTSTGCVCIGRDTGKTLTNATNCVIIGNTAASNAASGTVAIGYKAQGPGVSIGYQAGYATCPSQVAVGYQALSATGGTGSGLNYARNSVAIGTQALYKSGSASSNNASNNVAIGYQVLYNLTEGSGNCCLGTMGDGGATVSSCTAYTGYETNNLVLHNTGVVGDSNTIRLGTEGTHTKAFMAGIYGATGTLGATNCGVVIDSTGQIQPARSFAADATCKTISILKSRGTVGTPATIVSGDALGEINFKGHDGTGYITASRITSTNSGTVATNRIASDLKFYTHEDSTNASVLRLTIEPTADITIANAHTIRSGTTAADTMLLGAYDVDGTVDKTFITFTSNNTPTCDLDTAVTCAGNYIYRATGTDVPVTDGGTGLSTLTAHALYVGNGASAPTALAVGATGEILVGATGADCAWSASPTVTTMYATTFDTNVAAAAVTLAGTTLAADGSDTDISITITPKGAGTIVSSAVYSKQVTSNVRTLLVDDGGLIGNATSSLRFKDDVKDMGDDSSAIHKLRPVTFTYKADDKKKKQYGLIAEEVDKVMPLLVSYDEQGRPHSVSYHDLPQILLNEIQKMAKRINALEEKLKGK